ncbi:CRISPR-associated endoribonuclease Cas6 [Siminovitchia sp. FSL H7-0308]|uniref:CRISPR-associated endoribonuclease Cas6 n=1 Tax=Siminovitchia sp. FSL H7-0308 TaxID=2921432 RepID=UPI0030ECC0D9
MLPVNYQHLLQALVYSIFPQQEASYLHDQGYHYNNRTYKLFCFSKIKAKKTVYDNSTKKITFHDRISISISSILPELIEKTTNQILTTENLLLNGEKLTIDSIQFSQNSVTTNSLQVKANSPITVYSTYEKRDGSKITHYFSPHDPVFEHLIQENFARKYEAFTNESLEHEKELLSIRPVRVTNRDKVVTKYKNIWITGWTGIYEIKAKPEYLSFLLNAGLGSRNSSGFGFISPFQ